MGNYVDVVKEVATKDEETIELLKLIQYSKGNIQHYNHFSKKIIQNEK
jgi:hypothetical protein